MRLTIGQLTEKNQNEIMRIFKMVKISPENMETVTLAFFMAIMNIANDFPNTPTQIAARITVDKIKEALDKGYVDVYKRPKKSANSRDSE